MVCGSGLVCCWVEEGVLHPVLVATLNSVCSLLRKYLNLHVDVADFGSQLRGLGAGVNVQTNNTAMRTLLEVKPEYKLLEVGNK